MRRKAASLVEQLRAKDRRKLFEAASALAELEPFALAPHGGQLVRLLKDDLNEAARRKSRLSRHLRALKGAA